MLYYYTQFLGGICGAGILKLIVCNCSADISGLGTNGYGKYSAVGLNAGGAFLVEVILTFVFVFTVLGVTSKVKNQAVAGIVIGLTLTFVHIMGIPLTGTSVNPARSFGPALFTCGDALSQYGYSYLRLLREQPWRLLFSRQLQRIRKINVFCFVNRFVRR